MMYCGRTFSSVDEDDTESLVRIMNGGIGEDATYS